MQPLLPKTRPALATSLRAGGLPSCTAKQAESEADRTEAPGITRVQNCRLHLSESGRAPRPVNLRARMRKSYSSLVNPRKTPAVSRLAEKWLDINSSSTAETWAKTVDSFCFLGATGSHFYQVFDGPHEG